MEIKKNQLLAFVQSLGGGNFNERRNHVNQHQSNFKNKVGLKKDFIKFDQLRQEAMSLQENVKQLQTNISFGQTQLSFLKNITAKNGWQNMLTLFMKDKFQGQKLPDISNKKLNVYQNDLQTSIEVSKKELNKKQIKLQNIFATGIVSETSQLKNIFTDHHLKHTTNIFKELRKDVIKNLL